MRRRGGPGCRLGPAAHPRRPPGGAAVRRGAALDRGRRPAQSARPGAVPARARPRGNPNIQTLEEWGPLEFSTGPGGHWGYAATLVLLLVSPGVQPACLYADALLILVVFGAVPCLQQRMMVWWLISCRGWRCRTGRRWRSGCRRVGSKPATRASPKTLVVGVLALAVLNPPPAELAAVRGPRGHMGQAVSAGTPWPLADQLNAAATVGQAPALPRRCGEQRCRSTTRGGGSWSDLRQRDPG